MKQPCKNVKNKMYTGEENTPLGKGYHPSGEKIGYTMKGKNKKMYKVVKTKAGKRWQLVKKVEKKIKSPKRTKRGEKIDSLPEGLEEIGYRIDVRDHPLRERIKASVPAVVYGVKPFKPGDTIYFPAKIMGGFCKEETVKINDNKASFRRGRFGYFTDYELNKGFYGETEDGYMLTDPNSWTIIATDSGKTN